MTPELPFEIVSLSPRLHQDFDDKLPLATSGTIDERERNFLSRALAAFAIHRLTGCSLEDAAAAVVDGGGDGGIDAIYLDSTDHLWVIQSKYFSDGQGEPALGDVSKFRDGLESLLSGQFEAFAHNIAFQRRMAQIRQYFDNESLRIRVRLVYSGIHLVSDDRIRIFENLCRQFDSDPDYLTFQPINLTTLHDWLTNADQAIGVERIELTLYEPSRFATPYETFYGLIKLSDLATLQQQHGKRLVAANIRNYKGSTEVNQQILATIRDEPHIFFYLNNGLTAYCTRISVHNPDRNNQHQKRLTIYNVSIVNGAQTLGSVARFQQENPQATPDGYVFLKIISLQQATDSDAFAQRITRSTNFQNQIGLRDFVALDPEQERVQRHLAQYNIHYHYKDSEDTPDLDENNFTLDEATVALACLHRILDPERKHDFCTLVLADRKALWSQEEVLPTTDEHRSRYRWLFRPDRSARTIWRAVQTMRAVKARMQENGRAATGKRKEFFENARWLLLHILFIRKTPEQGSELALAAQEIDNIRQECDLIAEALWVAAESLGSTRHFKSVFCDAADCKRLKSATFARLNQNVQG